MSSSRHAQLSLLTELQTSLSKHPHLKGFAEALDKCIHKKIQIMQAQK